MLLGLYIHQVPEAAQEVPEMPEPLVVLEQAVLE
jgi:hypothetical protein